MQKYQSWVSLLEIVNLNTVMDKAFLSKSTDISKKQLIRVALLEYLSLNFINKIQTVYYYSDIRSLTGQPQMVPIYASFTRGRDNTYHVVIQ